MTTAVTDHNADVFTAPLVVGYKGEIGRFILAGLLEHLPKANDIHCVDVGNSEEDVIERIQKADYVFLCVPLQTTAEWLHRHLAHLGGKVVVEQTSVKGFLYQEPAFDALTFLSMHLLFRPTGTPETERRGLAFSERLPRDRVQAFCGEMEQMLGMPMAVLEGGWEAHDRLMARQQALVHRVLLALSDFLQDEHAMTFVGKRVADLAWRVRTGDPVLYRMIQENPLLEGELEEFQDRLSRFVP